MELSGSYSIKGGIIALLGYLRTYAVRSRHRLELPTQSARWPKTLSRYVDELMELIYGIVKGLNICQSYTLNCVVVYSSMLRFRGRSPPRPARPESAEAGSQIHI